MARSAVSGFWSVSILGCLSREMGTLLIHLCKIMPVELQCLEPKRWFVSARDAMACLESMIFSQCVPPSGH